MTTTPKALPEQLRILRHMLGIDVKDQPNPPEYRDYYCACPGDPELHEMARLGLVELYAVRQGYEWFKTTGAGKAAARASQQSMLLPKRKRVYLRFLSASDCFPDLTFKRFLTDPFFAEARKAA